MSVTSPDLNYSNYHYTHSQLKYKKILPVQSGDVNLQNAGTTETNFEIPSVVFNPGKSRLEFTKFIETKTDTYCIHTFHDLLDVIKTIELKTTSGVTITK